MSNPMIIDVPAVIRTAAALTSLLIFTNGCCSGCTKSVSTSSDVLKNSAAQTRAMVSTITAHSSVEIFSQTHTTTTATLILACTQVLLCVRNTYHQPSRAKPMALKRERMKATINSIPVSAIDPSPVDSGSQPEQPTSVSSGLH